MATTTTNFGWDIPQSTDLVKDGATAIATLGQDIDTALVDLKGGTTGQVLAKNSNTDLDYTWTTPQQGDITGVTAGTGISGGGTGGDVTITNSMATAIDAKGDLIAGTGADAFARLAIGTDGQTLTADSTAATGIKWATPSAGGETLISTTSLSGTSVTLNSIPTTYRHLFVEIINPFVSGDTSFSFNINSTAQFNRSGFYDRFFNGVTQTNWTGESSGTLPCNPDGNWSSSYQSGTNSGITLLIENYNGVTPDFTLKTQYRNGSGYSITGVTFAAFNYSYTAAVTSIKFNSGLTFTGGTIKLWGIK